MAYVTYEEKILNKISVHDYYDFLELRSISGVEISLLETTIGKDEVNFIREKHSVNSFHIPYHLDNDLSSFNISEKQLIIKEKMLRCMEFASSFANDTKIIIVNHLSRNLYLDNLYLDFQMNLILKRNLPLKISVENTVDNNINIDYLFPHFLNQYDFTLDLSHLYNLNDINNFKNINVKPTLVHFHSLKNPHKGLDKFDIEFLNNLQIKKELINLEILHSENYLKELNNSISLLFSNSTESTINRL
jgi:hypothetical protein